MDNILYNLRTWYILCRFYWYLFGSFIYGELTDFDLFSQEKTLKWLYIFYFGSAIFWLWIFLGFWMVIKKTFLYYI